MEYHKMRPRQVVQMREAVPVAYAAFGILEWHGLHNPLGLDGLKADGIAKFLASRLGGLVMPVQFWGDNRQEICERHLDEQVFPDARRVAPAPFNHGDRIMDAMKLTREAFSSDAERSKQSGGWRLWEELTVHMLFQLETLGFKLIVTIPGHYPLFEPMDNAIRTYQQQGGSSHVYSLRDSLYSVNNDAGDHAAAFETSLMMAIAPDLVDLTELETDLNETNVGVALGDDPRTHANAEYGADILNRFEQLIEHQFAIVGIEPKNS